MENLINDDLEKSESDESDIANGIYPTSFRLILFNNVC